MTFETPILSILIPTLNMRRSRWSNLLGSLSKQRANIAWPNMVQILSLADDGETPIGIKRNALISSAIGTYVCFIDDDDTVSDNYIPLIIKVLEKNPDCVELHGEIQIDGKTPKHFHHSYKIKKWMENEKEYFRPISHLNTIRKSIACQIPFEPSSKGEDYKWSLALMKKKLIKTEAKLNEIIYFYDYKTYKDRTELNNGQNSCIIAD